LIYEDILAYILFNMKEKSYDDTIMCNSTRDNTLLITEVNLSSQ